MSATLLERLGDELGSRASVSAVYGEPITTNGVTVIPVARIGFAFGAGAGAGHDVTTSRTGEGGGGGGGAGAQPLGFIEISNGRATYTAIRNPWKDAALPLAVLLTAIAAPRLVARCLVKRRAR
ncbi:spore germination protein GerW family protein [Streptomyces sp. NPDC058671]|uniref:spore germination protein GerW family protein n=1 Tax=Streptomyces sp. NPDC058671 TaxID=3346590 RepID=UPI00364E1CDF